MHERIQVDSSKCKACKRCEVACIGAHNNMDFKTAMKRRKDFVPRVWAFKGDDYKTSVRCHQCDPAPCCAVCPTGALQQDAKGTITMHTELCAACGMCVAVCPYGCAKIEQPVAPEDGVVARKAPTPHVVRCDLCVDWRRENGVAYTACMEACLARALTLVNDEGVVIEAPKLEKKAEPKAAVSEATPAEPAAEKTPSAPVAELEAQPAEKAAPAPALKAETKPAVPGVKDVAKPDSAAQPEKKPVVAEAAPEKPAETAKPQAAAEPKAEQAPLLTPTQPAKKAAKKKKGKK
ncbi:MAG: hypothetical protein K6F46_03530 [Desulfovibrio sp.]|nr:hypothetical protein [Desulfovibrio sp.]